MFLAVYFSIFSEGIEFDPFISCLTKIQVADFQIFHVYLIMDNMLNCKLSHTKYTTP